jgi:hypothetical protein
MRVGYAYRSTSEAGFLFKNQLVPFCPMTAASSLNETLRRIGMLRFKQTGKFFDISEMHGEHNFTDN